MVGSLLDKFRVSHRCVVSTLLAPLQVDRITIPAIDPIGSGFWNHDLNIREAEVVSQSFASLIGFFVP